MSLCSHLAHRPQPHLIFFFFYVSHDSLCFWIEKLLPQSDFLDGFNFEQNKEQFYLSKKKRVYSGIAGVLQFWTSKLSWTIGKSKETKGKLLLGFRGKLGRVFLNQSLLEKNKNLRLLQFLTVYRQWLVCCCCAGRDLLNFLKGEREIPVWKVISLVTIIVFLLPASYVGCCEWNVHASYPLRASQLHSRWSFLCLFLQLST